MIRRYLPESIEELILWYERRVAPFALLVGFLIDNVFFRAVNLWTATTAFILYLLLALVGIFLLNLVEMGRVKNAFVLKSAQFLPVIVQFAFGAIFSGFFVLYSQSATIGASWLSVVILALLLIGNERFRRRYRKFPFQVGILFFTIFGFLIFFVPLVIKRIGPEIFLASAVVSVIFIALYIYGMRRMMPELVTPNLIPITRTIAGILIIFNVLYFTNAIPPLPLALKDAGIYHSVKRESTGNYTLLVESVAWYEAYLPFNTRFHTKAGGGESAYAYSAIFAPSGLSTIILHEWQRYDTATEEWVTTDTLRFPIVGGRDGGYRGYSIKTGITPGKWRVNVITQYGQLIGRISFTVIDVPAPPLLEEIFK